MSRLSRFTQKLFGTSAGANEMAEFGSLVAGTPARYSGTTITPAIVQALGNYLGGWSDAVVGNNNPTIEDMNSLCYLYAYQLAYLMQLGVAEWDSGTTYYLGSLVQDGSGNIYKSLANSNTNNDLTNASKWANVGADRIANLAVSNWTQRSAAASNQWNAMTFANNLFVAVAGSGASRVMTSPDGVTWTGHSASEANTWQGITYGNSKYVAVSSDGTHQVMTSPDGATWTNQTASTAISVLGFSPIAYGAGVFVVISGNTSMTSSDGVTWTTRSVPGASTFWASVTFGNNLFVMTSQDGKIATSPDGITWTTRTSPQPNDWTSVTYGNGLFVAVSSVNTDTHQVMYSTDGITWSSADAPYASSWQPVTYGNGLFVAIDSSSSTGDIMTSTDGVNWKHRVIQGASSFSAAITYGHGFFSAADFGGGKVYNSLTFGDY